ncbi:aspartate/glutamate racemase family protein [Brevibacterium sp. 50QC2O2]|uniref:aspartate/glutamate racemase family protein n=1 Tax=Brevibacterium sp. 50QC2O2 TaxID=2968459 RepID=UPI00211C0E43|nr:aspartate/glutamate racemase family protein [Brevibacterium sp. 50QC2O2]MCQ9388479.1 aspartate/glutamate racemase family protein [Brevibacterium sp. 50QC2O2]
MHLRVILPITAQKLLGPVEVEAKSWASPGTVVDTVQIAHGPESIESDYDEALALPAILNEVSRAVTDGVDGIFVSCFAEPAVHAAREIARIPIFGGFQPAVHSALGMADRIGILSILPDVLPGIDRRVGSYGLRDRIVAITSVDMGVLEVDQHDVLLDRLEAAARDQIVQHRAEAFILGCTGMIGVAAQLQERLSTDGPIPVLDPTGAAIVALESAIRLNLKPSSLAYHAPRPKSRS